MHSPCTENAILTICAGSLLTFIELFLFVLFHVPVVANHTSGLCNACFPKICLIFFFLLIVFGFGISSAILLRLAWKCSFLFYFLKMFAENL